MAEVHSYIVFGFHLNKEKDCVEPATELRPFWLQLDAKMIDKTDPDEYWNYESDEETLSKCDFDKISDMANAEWGAGNWYKLEVKDLQTFNPFHLGPYQVCKY